MTAHLVGQHIPYMVSRLYLFVPNESARWKRQFFTTLRPSFARFAAAMSQTSLPPPPDASSATENSATFTENHIGADTVVHSAGLSESYVGGLGASANTTEVDQNTQRLAGTSAVQAGPSQFGYYYPTGQAPSSHRAQYAYYPVPAVAWGNPWPSPYAEGPSGAAPYYSYSHPQIGSQPSTPLPTSFPTSLTTGVSQQKPPSIFPPPSPALQVQGHWDSIIREFLSSAGLTQALRGFEADVIVMGPDWERKRVPLAIEDLVKKILVCISDCFKNTKPVTII